MKTVIVAGASGLIGQHLLQALSQRDVNVFPLNRPWGEVPQADFIVHAAGYAQPAKFMADPMGTIAVNTLGLMRLKECLKPGGRLLYLSSSEVYWGNENPPYHEDDIGTTGPLHVRAPYIEAKRIGETICLAARAQGIDATIARVSLSYGPGVKKDDSRVMNQFIQQALTTGCIRMRDRGEAMRAYCYVEDTAAMLVNVLFYGTQPIYNIGGIHQCTILQLAQEIACRTDAEVLAPKDSTTSGAPEVVFLDTARYCSDFGRPDYVNIDDGLDRTIAYHRTLL